MVQIGYAYLVEMCVTADEGVADPTTYKLFNSEITSEPIEPEQSTALPAHEYENEKAINRQKILSLELLLYL